MALREDLVSVSYLNNVDSVVKMCKGKVVSLDEASKQNVSNNKASWSLIGKVVKILDKSPKVNFVWKQILEVEDLCKTAMPKLTYRLDCYGDFALNMTLRNVSEGDCLIITSPKIDRKQGSEKAPVIQIGLGYDPRWNIVICRHGSEPETQPSRQMRRQPRDGRHHYTLLKDCQSIQDRYNVWAVVTKCQSSKRTRMGDFFVRLSVKDESLEMEVTVFYQQSDNLPTIYVGDIVRFSHLRVEKFNGPFFTGVVNRGAAMVAFKGESGEGFDPKTSGCFEVSNFDKMLIIKLREWKNFWGQLVEETGQGTLWHYSNNIIPFQSQPNFPNSEEFNKIVEFFNTQAALDGMMDMSNGIVSKVCNDQAAPEMKKGRSCVSAQEINVERRDSQLLLKAKKKSKSRMSITTRTAYPIVSTEKELRQMKGIAEVLKASNAKQLCTSGNFVEIFPEFSKAKLWCNFDRLKVRDRNPLMMVCGICVRCSVTRNVPEPSYPESEFLCSCGKKLKLGYRFQICVTDSLGVPVKLIYAGTSGKILGCSANKFLHSKATREKIIAKISQLKKRPALISILIAGKDISDDFKFHVVKSSFAFPKIIVKQVAVTKI